MTKGKGDPRLVLRRLAALDRALDQLDLHRSDTAEDVRQNLDREWAVEHGLQLAAQSLLDIAAHLAAAGGRDVPDYASAVAALADLGILDAQLARRCRPVAGFRNVLVHDYLDVDLDVVVGVLTSGLDDLRAFSRAIRTHLEKAS